MSTPTQRNVQRMIEAGAVLVLMGVGLNLLVTQTLGTFDAALVLLALYVALWAYVLGSIILIVLSIWLLLTRKSFGSKETDVKPESEGLSPGKRRPSPFRAAYRTH
jgi:hypothetical protein